MIFKRDQMTVERTQQRHDAGFVAAHFPEVASIVVSMRYNQRGIKQFLRTVNFFPSSHAFFRVSCLSKDCIDGGFDLTQIITTMIENRNQTAKGDLSCEGTGPSSGHSIIVYEVAIEYS